MRHRILSRFVKSQHQVGLLPSEGWRKKNLQFLGGVLIPSLLTPRLPGHLADAVPDALEHEIGVTWLGHAAFLIQIEGINVLIDPNWALWHGPVKRVRHPALFAHDLPEIDLVLITHAHFDHLHLPSLKRIANGQPVVVPKGVGDIVKRLDFGRVIELDTWQTAPFRDLTITLTPAKHWGARMIHDVHRHFGGYLVQSSAKTVYHCGDSAMFDGFAEIGKRAAIDAALMPIGAYDNPSCRPVHMNPEEALDAFEMMGAHCMVPMHHDTFPLSGEPLHEPVERLRLASDARGLTERVHILREGESLLL
jgi:L-ascorbate metabolism protein UlaG (beta-lactamase superfamily)